MDEKQIQKLKEEASQPTLEYQREILAKTLLDHIEEMQRLVVALNKIR